MTKQRFSLPFAKCGHSRNVLIRICYIIQNEIACIYVYASLSCGNIARVPSALGQYSRNFRK